MSWTRTESLQEAHAMRRGYRQEVECTTCGERWEPRYWEGEPAHDDALNCHCGGRGEPT